MKILSLKLFICVVQSLLGDTYPGSCSFSSEGHFLVGEYSLVGDLISVSLGLKQAAASGLDIFIVSGNSSDELISKLQLNGKFNLLKFRKHVCLNFVDT